LPPGQAALREIGLVRRALARHQELGQAVEGALSGRRVVDPEQYREADRHRTRSGADLERHVAGETVQGIVHGELLAESFTFGSRQYLLHHLPQAHIQALLRPHHERVGRNE
jgi:hypothetical protein